MGWHLYARYEGERLDETGDSGKFIVYPESLRSERTVSNWRAPTRAPTAIDCVMIRNPARNADVAAQSRIVCHAAYIAWQLGRPVKFDPSKKSSWR